MTQAAALVDTLKTYIADANDMCARGAYMDLEGLDSRVQTICSAIEALPAAEAKAYASELDAMMEALEALQQLFESKRAALGDELDGTTKHHKAAKAYKRSDYSAPQEGQ